jgi:hypothetical protein
MRSIYSQFCYTPDPYGPKLKGLEQEFQEEKFWIWGGDFQSCNNSALTQSIRRNLLHVD